MEMGMVEEKKSATFDLRTAKSLIAEVKEETEYVVELYSAATEKGFGKTWKALGQVGRLKKNLDIAINLAKKASEAEPNAVLPDGTTCKTLIAEAHFQKGLIALGTKGYKEAISHFETSFKIEPSQEALINIAICKLAPIDDYIRRLPSFDPLGLGRRGVRKQLEKTDAFSILDQVVSMNPESDTAVEAGKLIAKWKSLSE